MNLIQVELWPALLLLVKNTEQWLGCGRTPAMAGDITMAWLRWNTCKGKGTFFRQPGAKPAHGQTPRGHFSLLVDSGAPRKDRTVRDYLNNYLNHHALPNHVFALPNIYLLFQNQEAQDVFRSFF